MRSGIETLVIKITFQAPSGTAFLEASPVPPGERGSMPAVVIVVGSTSRFLGLVTLPLNSFMNLATGPVPPNQHHHYA